MAARPEHRAYWDVVALEPDGLPDGWRRHGRSVHLDLVERWVGEPTGRWLKSDLYEERDDLRSLLPHLQSAQWVAVDLSPEVVHLSGASRSSAADVRLLPFGDGVFDGALSTSTLDHFDTAAQIERSLTELRRVLRPGGDLVLTLDNPSNPLIRVRNSLPPAVSRRTGLVPFSVGATLGEAEGRRALEDAGFAVRSVEHLLHAPHVVGTRLARWAWWERRALPGFDRLATTRVAPWTGHFVAFHAQAATH